MNELDKYFEKARNTNPIYEKDDAKKLLYGKLGDGGIATNLYNKIKVYPMITALITSVATVATIALISISSPNEKSATPITTSSEEIVQIPEVEPIATTESMIEPEEFAQHEKNTTTNQEEHKKSDESNNKNFNWTEEKIDLKTVNALKLTKEELANLGIVINENKFKINAFDKYTYTINQANEKTRDYYNKDKDSEAYPTPAMVTTSSGFKTLTLFKKGNVEATVDRYSSDENEHSNLSTIIEKHIEVDDANVEINVNKVNSDSVVFLNKSDMKYIVDKDTINVSYSKETDTSEKSLTIKFPKNYKNIKNLDAHNENLDILVNKLDDREIATVFRKNDSSIKRDTLISKIDLGPVSSEFFDEPFDTRICLIKSLEGNPDSAYVMNNVERIKSIGLNYEFKRIRIDYQQVINKDNYFIDFKRKNKEIMFDVPLDSTHFNSPAYTKTFKVSFYGFPDFFDKNPRNIDYATNNEEIEIDISNDDTTNTPKIENENQNRSKTYEINLGGKTFSIEFDKLLKDGKLDVNKYKEFIVDISEDLGKNIKLDSRLSSASDEKIEGYQVYIEPKSKLVINNGNNDLKFNLKPNQKISADISSDGKTNMYYSNMGLDFISYNINELIPIEISFDGKTTDFIVWYEANDEFLNKLPKSQLDKINPELLALKGQQDHCKNEPVEKEKTVMDVWSGCSGAIKDMHVFPNPAISNSNIEFDLEESRVISIAIYDLSGKLIKRIADNLNLSKGQITESLNLNGVKSGLYYVVVKSDKNEQALQRIIVE